MNNYPPTTIEDGLIMATHILNNVFISKGTVGKNNEFE